MVRLHNVVPFDNFSEVTILQEQPYRLVTVRLDGDVRSESEVVVVNKALEQLYQEWYPNRAETERMEEMSSVMNTFIEETSRTIQETLKAVVHIDSLDEAQIDLLYSRFPSYQPNIQYETGDVFKHENVLYEVVQSHVSQAQWVPSDTPALYKVYRNIDTEEAEIIDDYVQPQGAHDAYGIGDKVRFNGKIYESLIGANVWSPSDNPQGWKEII